MWFWCEDCDIDYHIQNGRRILFRGESKNMKATLDTTIIEKPCSRIKIKSFSVASNTMLYMESTKQFRVILRT